MGGPMADKRRKRNKFRLLKCYYHFLHSLLVVVVAVAVVYSILSICSCAKTTPSAFHFLKYSQQLQQLLMKTGTERRPK